MKPSNFDLENFLGSCFLDFKNESDNGDLFFSGLILCRSVVPGGAGGAMAPPDFGRLVDLISPGRADYAHLAPPDFQTFLRPC